MSLGRLLLFVAILALLPLLRRILFGFFAGMFGKPARSRTVCPQCSGSGWITAGAGVKKACGCGAIPPEGRGPIIDVEGDRRADGR